MVAALADLFPAGSYRFHLSLRREDPLPFFRPQDPTGRLLAERARWLTAEPRRYAGLLAEGEPLFQEFRALLVEWRVRSGPSASIHALGAELEPDILFLSGDAEGGIRLQGGALCFPTGWALDEKLGRPMDFIHGVVPGLNASMGGSIQQFLSRAKPGAAYFRDNWGLAATDELNLHPQRRIPPPSPPVDFERLWLRVEHQVLLALPQTRGIVFGIRIALHRLDAVARDPAAAGLKQALLTMPSEIAAYKRLDTIRDDVVRRL